MLIGRLPKAIIFTAKKIQLELINADGNQLGNYSIPRGTPAHDEEFGQVEIFHDELGFDVSIARKQRRGTNRYVIGKIPGMRGSRRLLSADD